MKTYNILQSKKCFFDLEIAKKFLKENDILLVIEDNEIKQVFKNVPQNGLDFAYCELIDFAIESTTEYKQIIRDLLNIYVVNVDSNGNPKASLTEIMNTIDKAKKLIEL